MNINEDHQKFLQRVKEILWSTYHDAITYDETKCLILEAFDKIITNVETEYKPSEEEHLNYIGELK